MRVEIPTIRTERLVLAPPVEADAVGLASILCSDRARHVDGPMSPRDAWLEFVQLAASWTFRGYGGLSIRPAGDTGAYLGTILVMQEFGDPEPELGWLLTEEAEGHGYAYEAAVAMRAWAFEHTALDTLVSYIRPDNVRSIRLAERLGGVPEPGHAGCIAYRYRP